jgi:hypothetical protein
MIYLWLICRGDAVAGAATSVSFLFGCVNGILRLKHFIMN